MEDERVKFERCQQKLFLKFVINRLGYLSLRKLPDNLGFSYSAFKSYYQEKCLMPKFLVEKLCSLSKININELDISYLPSNWGEKKGGKIGIYNMMEKHKSKLTEWRIKGGRNSSIKSIKKIKHPELNEDLAEFIGVYLGDGTLTKYFIRVSGDYRYDLPYFNYLSKLTFRLFGVNPTVYKEKNRNTAYLAIFSKELCSFLNKKYSINFGNKIKNKTQIPEKILQSRKLSTACLRGLIDTDGSVSRRGRKGSQFCIQFTSHNIGLLNQVNEIGKNLKIFTYFTGNNIGTNKWENILRYFKIAGSSNLKHIVRFHLRNYKNKTIYLREVPLYFKKNLYSNMNLPFKMDPWSSG